MPPAATTQILLLENDGLVRAGMRALIQGADPTGRIYEASSYEQAVLVLSQVSIDIAFLDFDLRSDKTGLDVLRVIRQTDTSAHTIMLSAHTDREFVLHCLDAGACGYIPKTLDDDGSVFRRALETVFDGRIFLPASVLGRGGVSPEHAVLTPRLSAADLGMSPRQMEVLYYLCQGLTNKAIAQRLGISPDTVRKDYVTQLLRIFNVARRTQLMIEIARRGISIPMPTAPRQPDMPGESLVRAHPE